MRIRPSAPPFFFWKSSASTTCSRLTLCILVSTRPMGRPLSSSMAGIPPGAAPPGGVGPPRFDHPPPGGGAERESGAVVPLPAGRAAGDAGPGGRAAGGADALGVGRGATGADDFVAL